MCYPKDDREKGYQFLPDEIFKSDDPNAHIKDVYPGGEGIPWMNMIDNGKDTKRLVVLQAPMAMGKTHEMACLVLQMRDKYKEYIDSSEGREKGSVLVLTHRRALGMDQANRMTCHFYQDMKMSDGHYEEYDENTGTGLGQVRYLVCCVNSIHHIKDTHIYQTVIIDEAGLVRQHCCSDICRNIEGVMFNSIRRILQKCKSVVIAQELLTEDDVEFWATFLDIEDINDRSCIAAMKFEKPQSFHPVAVTKHLGVALHTLVQHYKATLVPLKQGRRSMDAQCRGANATSPFAEPYHLKPLIPGEVITSRTFSVHTDESSYLWRDDPPDDQEPWEEVDDDEPQPEKAVASCFCVFSTSKTFADLAEVTLKQVAEENKADPKRIRKVTGDNKLHQGFCSRFLSAPNDYAHMADVLIATNVIGAGFSIDRHFSHWFGFFFTGILTHGEEWQLSKRCRFEMKQFLNDERRISLMYIGKWSNLQPVAIGCK